MKNRFTSFLTKSLFVWSALIMSVAAQAQTISLPAVSASITFTNPITSSNMSLVVDNNSGDEAYTEVATIAGTPCRKIPAGKFMYISCNRATIPTSQNNLLIAVTYYANSANNIWFNYDGTSNNYAGADFQKVNTGDWVTTIVTITDAALNGLMNGGADFRMGFNAEDNYIKEIKVYKGSLDPVSQPVPANPNSSISGFKNKSFAGYQIWHQAGNNAADWVHWSYGVVPAAGFHVNEDIASFPDLSQYPTSDTYPTNFANLGNGTATRLYNDADANIINRQMGWVQTAGLDGVAIQRFVGPIGKSVTITSQSSLTNVKNACEATGRLFYICYDLNGTDATILQRMQMDWVYEIEQMRALTSSPNYATVNGKPVVEMWGVGYSMATSTQCAQLISFLKSRGCYVIGGTPSDWRTNPGAGFDVVFKSLDCVSPWTVGVYNTPGGADSYLSNTETADKSYCTANNMDFLPVAFAGGANWVNNDMTLSQTDRQGGNLLWEQVRNAKSLGLTSVYLAMLDEFEESTNLINGAVDYFDIPTDQYFETFAKDGIWVGSDYYLRLAATAAKMLRGDIANTATIPIEYSLGPVYHRNSFESRATTINTEGRLYNTTLKIDPSFYSDAQISATGVSGQSISIVNEPANTKSGLYSVKVTGNTTSGSSSNHYYKTNVVKITVKANMQLSFWKKTIDALGQYTSVDLLFQSGKRLSTTSGYTDNNGSAMTPTVARGTVGGSWEKFICQIGTGVLVGDVITGIIIGYDHPSASGSYNAYFDDIIIEDGITQTPYLGTPWPIAGTIQAENYDVGGEGISYHDLDATNTLGAYRTGTNEGVDIEAASDGGYDVGFIQTGEWMEYTVNVTTATTYTLAASVAANSVGTYTFHVEMDGIDISGPITFGTTGGWQAYQNYSATTSSLTTGTKVMRIVIDAGGFNLSSVTFSPSIALGILDFGNASNPATAQGSSVAVYPNPVKEGQNISIQFVNPQTEKYQVHLYNYMGQTIAQLSVKAVGGSSTHTLPLPQQVIAGTYLLEILNESGERTLRKIIVQE